MKIGILGGTFNPIHLAHLSIAKEVMETCALDQVLFIPASEPPHKDIAGEVSFAHRFAMVEAAIKGHAGFQASDLEIQRSGKSYSVDTLEILRRKDPEGELFFIIGLDSYRDISFWKEFARIFTLSHVVVTTRPGVIVEEPLAPLPVAMHEEFCYADNAGEMLHKSGNRLIFLKETCLDISSTQIRSMLVEGQPVSQLVPPEVLAYIKENGLYRV